MYIIGSFLLKISTRTTYMRSSQSRAPRWRCALRITRIANTACHSDLQVTRVQLYQADVQVGKQHNILDS